MVSATSPSNGENPTQEGMSQEGLVILINTDALNDNELTDEMISFVSSEVLRTLPAMKDLAPAERKAALTKLMEELLPVLADAMQNMKKKALELMNTAAAL